MLNLQQYDLLEAAAREHARDEDLTWDEGAPLFFVYRDGAAVLANPYEGDIKPGELFVAFQKMGFGPHAEVNPMMTHSRCVQVMGEDGDSATAHFIEGDYLAKDSICLLGYRMQAGQKVVSESGTTFTILMFAQILGVQHDVYLTAIQPAVLEDDQGNIAVAGIGGWLRTVGTRQPVAS